MKRSGSLQRKTPLKTKAPLKNGSTLERRAPLKPRSTSRRSMGKPDPRWRNRAYLNWVKRQPCVVCGRPADDPHHLIGLGGLGGIGTKAPDQYVMPVCREHHDEIHRTPDLWPQQWEWIARTMAKAIEEGVFHAGVDE